MITVEFLGPIGLDPIEVDVSTLGELSKVLKEKAPVVVEWLDKSAVALNDVMIEDTSVELKAGDRISLLPPVCGG